MKISKEKDWADNSQEVTHRLKTLLDSCEVKAPYILVGHSLGGLYAQKISRVFNTLSMGKASLD
jgi:surfactin synthase thioesterase subunit